MDSILIIADEKSLRTDLAAYLRGRGHVVETLAEAAETLPAVARRDFDLILIDIEPNGFPLLRQILRQRPDAAVALTAGRASVGEAVQAMRAGAYDYLGRPLSPRQVELLIRRAAAARDAQRAVLPDATTALSLQEIEQLHISNVLRESATIGEAAARLGIDPATLWRKRKRYGLAPPRSGNPVGK